MEIRVPDIGGFADVPVIEVLVKPGDRVNANDSLVVLESEKASMEVPSPANGVVETVTVKPGDKVSEGSVIATLATEDAPQQRTIAGPKQAAAKSPTANAQTTDPESSQPVEPIAAPVPAQPPAQSPTQRSNPIAAVSPSHASPMIRRFARELGVDLPQVLGTGPNGRITRDDVQAFVKSHLAATPAQSGSTSVGSFGIANVPAWPSLDFAKFGEVERKPLSRIQRLSGPNLHRNWLQIPHITNYDEADITELEVFRNNVNAEQRATGGPKLTMLAFLVKAVTSALQRFPTFNASLDGESLIYKKYCNIGFAADTPDGLVVPVLKNTSTKGLLEIARESAELAAKARDGKLSLAQMQGGSFTISSIGGIGGTQFTQIVNAPEVAILGATRATLKPVWNGSAFMPRLILPISLSYDHRVIDGASAAHFLVYVVTLLRDFRRAIL